MSIAQVTCQKFGMRVFHMVNTSQRTDGVEFTRHDAAVDVLIRTANISATGRAVKGVLPDSEGTATSGDCQRCNRLLTAYRKLASMCG